eukprot:SAG31_NODE_12019_length_976_cov_3.855188_1_plen_173_part_00
MPRLCARLMLTVLFWFAAAAESSAQTTKCDPSASPPQLCPDGTPCPSCASPPCDCNAVSPARAPRAGSPACDAALRKACDAARREGLSQCAFCTGANQSALQRAGCNSSYVQSFCSNQTCAAQLEDRCAASASPAASGDNCASCVRCAETFPAVCAPAADAACADACSQSSV